jgi:hypothetical protein
MGGRNEWSLSVVVEIRIRNKWSLFVGMLMDREMSGAYASS